MDNNGLLSGI